MTATKPEPVTMRTPFPAHQISKLPKETRAQIDARKTDKSLMVWKCEVCGGAHHKNAVHLDYVGHAALTDRMLDVDLAWSWEPVAFDERGLPAFDHDGGLWIKLTINGVTRMGYGDADGKTGGNARKEAIGDALRNAAMRFGAALDLWHKGDLHLDDEGDGGGHSSGAHSAPPVPEPPARTNFGGLYPTKTAMREARIAHHAELTRIGQQGTFDDLDDYLTREDYKAYIATATTHFPNWLEGALPEGAPPEYVQTFALESKARDMIAIRGNTRIHDEELQNEQR